MIVEFFIRFLVSICVFLFGMKIMTEGLEKAATNTMKKILSKISGNPLIAVGMGTAATVVTSSSTAVTVLTVGLVNAGVMSLFQAINIIMGSNIGTTVSGLMVALDGLNLSLYFSFLTVIGLLLMYTSKNIKIVKLGEILLGFGIVFVGMLQMSNAVNMIRDEPWFLNIFTLVSNPLILMLIGAVITGLIQSSSAVNAVIIVLVGSEVLDIVDAVFITLGTNIGTCFTAIMASIGTSTAARRVSIFHLLFNVIGAILFAIPLIFYGPNNTYELMNNLFGETLEFQIAWFNFWQNLLSTIIMLPFLKYIIILCEKLVPDDTLVTSKTNLEDLRRN